MKIERANINDDLILSDIAFKGKSYWNYTIEQLNSWKDELTISKDYINQFEVYKLIDKKQIIGFFSLLEIDSKTIKVDYFFMYPEFIGKGNGKRLIKSVIELSIKKSAKRIILDADPNAQKFYEHFGFIKYDEFKSSIKGRFLPQMELIIK